MVRQDTNAAAVKGSPPGFIQEEIALFQRKKGNAMQKTGIEKSGLLDTLTVRTGYMYKSDLQRPECLPQIRYAVGGIAPEQYSRQEWNDAIHYITRKKSYFRSQKQAASFLKTYEGI